MGKQTTLRLIEDDQKMADVQDWDSKIQKLESITMRFATPMASITFAERGYSPRSIPKWNPFSS
jgi:hypothetical protein